MISSTWPADPADISGPADIVLCMPFAGGAASFFRSWRPGEHAKFSLWPVQLPGREERLDEDPYTDVHHAVAGLAAELSSQLPAGARVALFGHSLGAVLAFELARQLESWPEVTVTHVFVSGSPAPGAGRTDRASGLNDDEFLARVREFAGYWHPAFGIPELRELILPVLRADVLMHEDYAELTAEPIKAPITCLRGDDDDLVAAADCLLWADRTSATFEYCALPGGHMYVTELAEDIVALITGRLARGIAVSLTPEMSAP